MTDGRTCKRTPHVMADHLGARPGSTAGREAARHIAECPDCQAELASLEPVTARLRQWRDQPVPAWNRRPQGRAPVWRNMWLRWQWAPLAASMVLALAVLFNVQVGVNEAGWQIAFGGASFPSDSGRVDGAPVRRPDAQALRQSMALSLEDVESPRPPGDIDESQIEQWRDDVAAFERQLYDVLCRHAANTGIPDDESLAVVVSGVGGSRGEDGRDTPHMAFVGRCGYDDEGSGEPQARSGPE